MVGSWGKTRSGFERNWLLCVASDALLRPEIHVLGDESLVSVKEGSFCEVRRSHRCSPSRAQ